MTNDDITQQLALLPEGLAESNSRSWGEVASSYKDFVDHPMGNYRPVEMYDKFFLMVYNFVTDFSKTEQAKLFRAGKSVYDLMISTTERHGLRVGELFVAVTFRESFIIAQLQVASQIRVDENPNIIKRIFCSPKDDLSFVLQPLLKLLWDKTRGKKKA